MNFTLPHSFSVLRHRSFAFYLVARLAATMAMQMVNVAVGWQVYALSGRVSDLAFIGLAQFAPFVLLVLPAGDVADRLPRQRILGATYALQGFAVLCLLWFSWQQLHVVWPVFCVLILAGIARAFGMPAGQAIVMNLVPTEQFGQATALSSSGFHVAVISGPVLGGFLYLAGPSMVYGVALSLLVLAFVCSLAVITPPQKSSRRGLAWHECLEGFRFVLQRPIVLGAISLDLFAVLFGGAVALLPVYAKDVLHVGPIGLGLLRSAPAVGAAITSIALMIWPIHRRVGLWMFAGVALFGVATIGFGLSTIFALSLLALFLTGVGDMVSVYIRHLLVQLETPDAIRGRVSAVNAVFIGASNELGEFESGMAAAAFGLVPSVVLGGVATLAITGIWMKLFPSLVRMDGFPDAEKTD